MFRILVAAVVVLASYAASTQAHCVRCQRTPVRTVVKESAQAVGHTAEVVCKGAKCAACQLKNRVVEPTLAAGAEVVRGVAKAAREYSIRVQSNRCERAAQRQLRQETRELERQVGQPLAEPSCEADAFTGETISGTFSETK